MNPEHEAWIAANVTETFGKCREVTEQMAAAFPELRRVRGHYYCASWGEREHWWLVDAEGEVVDPTAAQFPTRGAGAYVEWEKDRKEPTGMCPNCGEYCYDGHYFCSERCGISYTAFCSRGI